MSSYSNKGNKTYLLYVILASAGAIVLVLCGSVMLSTTSGRGHYNNPKVATSVVSGSIYDRNGRALAVEIPSWDVYFDKEQMKDINTASQIVCLYSDTTPGEIISCYNSSQDRFVQICTGLTEFNTSQLAQQIGKNNMSNCISIRKNSKRDYPATSHGALLIGQTESAMSDILAPRPGYNENITYGQDVMLTIDLDIQYILDIAVQNIRSNAKTSGLYSFIADTKTGEILAMTTTPATDPTKGEKAIDRNLAFIPQISTDDGMSVNLYFIKDNPGVIPPGYKYSEKMMKGLLSDSRRSIITGLPTNNPKYLVVIASQDPLEDSVMKKVCTMIASSLSAQGKIN